MDRVWVKHTLSGSDIIICQFHASLSLDSVTSSSPAPNHRRLHHRPAAVNSTSQLIKSIRIEEMRPDNCDLKKRKLFVTTAEDVGLPALKHICCEVISHTECKSLYGKSVDVEDVEILDTLTESAQDSNSVAGDSQSYTTESMSEIARFLRKTDSYDEDSAWATSRLVTSGNDNDSLLLENIDLISRDVNEMEDRQLSHQHNNGSCSHDLDFDVLEECMSANYRKDSKHKTADELEEFFSSSGVNAALFTLPSERNADQSKLSQKATIDQEFEQYFSSLML